jgi:hypothetical protein
LGGCTGESKEGKVVALEKVKRAILVMVTPEDLQFLWSEGASKIPMLQEQI